MEGDYGHKKQFNKKEKQAILESIRCHLLTPLDVIIGYSEILSEEFSYEQDIFHRDEKTEIQCNNAIKNILDDAQVLQRRVELAFNVALGESRHQSFDLGRFIEILHTTLLTPLYSIVANNELLQEKCFSSYGQQFDDAQQIVSAAQLFISSVKKLYSAAKTKGDELRTYLIKMTSIVARTLDSLPTLKISRIATPSIGGSILIVEDNPMISALLQRQVEFFGYTAKVCSTADTLKKALTTTTIDLIILQAIMAQEDAFKILQEIKSNEHFKMIPIIIISPLKKAELIEKFFELGASDYLIQPLQSVVFRSRANDLIEKKKLLDKEQEYIFNIRQQKGKIENTLLQGLPNSIAERVSTGEIFIADRSEEASVLFADIAEFSDLVERLSPHQTVHLLNIVFSAIDSIIDKYQVEKIKTIGDSYMAVSGIPTPNHHHADAIAQVALEMLEIIKKINSEEGLSINLRIGINSGPVVAGIIGTKKIKYDVWGQTVNAASRLESQGVAGKIQVSQSTYNLLKNKYDFIYRGEIDLRSIGLAKTYFLVGPKMKKSKG